MVGPSTHNDVFLQHQGQGLAQQTIKVLKLCILQEHGCPFPKMAKSSWMTINLGSNKAETKSKRLTMQI